VRWSHIFAILSLAAISVSAFAGERVHVAVMGLFHPKQLVVEASPSAPMLVESGRKQFVAGVGAAECVSVSWLGSRIIARMAGERLEGEKITFTARDGSESEFFLSVPGKLRRRYRGKLVIVSSSGELVPVVDTELETAVASVVAAEMPSDAPLEALKAQAVVSRSYLVSSGHRHPYSDFCDTTHCQFLREPPPAGSPAALAARATKGLVLAWKGKPFPAMFSASCGGHTHSLAQVGYTPSDYPYYSVECPYCHRVPDKWSSRLSEKDAAVLTSNNETTRIKTGRKLGRHAVQSNTYTRTTAPGVVDLSGVGRGHGIGLCQRGAAGMARERKDFRVILAHYFPNTTIESGASH
jgi:peptidoglycan hydrolase-like amidase